MKSRRGFVPFKRDMNCMLKANSILYCFKFIIHTKDFEKTNFKNFSLKAAIDLLAILQKSLDRALFLYISIHEIRSSGVRTSITFVHIRKFYKM